MAKQKNKETEKGSDKLLGVQWRVNDVPPWHLCGVLGLQHYLAMFVGSLSVPFVLTPALCVGEDNIAKSEIIGTLFFVSGIITLLQIFLGVRLPMVQAGSFAILSPTLSYLRLSACPNLLPPGLCPRCNITDNNSLITGGPEHRDLWQSRLAHIQGSLMVASLLEVILGFSGTIGFLLRYIGPLSIAPTISLLGISLFRSAAEKAALQWWIAVGMFSLIVIFSQYLARIRIPLPAWSKLRGWHRTPYPLFEMFPIILAMMIMWLLCYIFTLTDVFPDDPDAWGYGARTDIRGDVIQDAAWFRIPYPGQWGVPKFDISLMCGLLAGLMASTVESVGDYYACARLAGAPPPPVHAINRGIAVEGLGSIFAGAVGTGNGTTSTSINVGVIGLTKSGSRTVIVVACAFMIVLAVINKFGALFVTVPDPIIGGSFFVLFGMIVSVGISNLKDVDMNSSRNMFVFGFSFFLGLTVSEWLNDNPGAIDTGSEIADNIITVLLSTSMFVGGITGFFLDNTIPGTRKARGMTEISTKASTLTPYEKAEIKSIYGLPFCEDAMAKSRMSRYLPFCSGFEARDLPEVCETEYSGQRL
ncbi:hypothetical protein CAPTEDRAFT_174658 [Capitella teleta]|uniref:Solute carrier family 23 member 2 n=1 Tax=Capitella teleta TaxID=283909 RepID=R7TWR5_CAPTE|nr:hypothetical protein CAPTEDRAFT_174658 [Capitella teleta]|eukprot:ELT95871.1 hypothetical protein CAPTEDRAFT_174658 [Capitella teleta]